jgi:hypothetical protein
LIAAVLSALLAFTPMAAATAQTPTTQPKEQPFTDKIYYGDCRDNSAGLACVQDPWTGTATVSPHLIREGEKINLSFALEPGGVDFTMPKDDVLCGHESENRDTEVQKDGRWVVENKPNITSSWCLFKPGSTHGKWSTMSVDVIGPCGSQIAVQEGRAEFAACAGTYGSDYYGVIGKDEDLWGISGRVTLSDGRGMPGVPISVSGPESRSAITGPGGDYAFAVKKGTYKVSAGAKVCVKPQTGACSSSTSVTLPGSAAVNFGPAAEAVIRGTVFGEDSKPKQGVGVRIVGPDGINVTSDDKGHYEARVAKGSYTVSASLTETPPLKPGEQGPALPKTTNYCADDHGTFPKKCTTEVTVDAPPDHSVNFALARDPNDIQVELSGEQVVKGKTFVTTMKLTNPRNEDLTNLTFAAGGLANESVMTIGGDAVVPSADPDAVPKLPTTLQARETATVKFRYDTPYPGQVVQTANVSGTLPDSKVVKGTQAMTVEVGRPLTKDDIKGATIDGTRAALDLMASKQEKLDALFAKAHMNDLTPHYDPVDLAVANAYGIPVSDAHLLNQNVDEAKAYFGGFGEEFIAQKDKFGKEGGQAAADLVHATWDRLWDPEGRAELTNAFVEGAIKMGQATKDNTGYIFESLRADFSFEGVKNIRDANVKLLADTGRALDEARMGVGEVLAQDEASYKKDPIGYRAEQGKAHGGATFQGVKEGGLAVVTEVGMKGVATASSKLLEATGLRRMQVSAEELEGAAAAGSDVAAVDEAAAAAKRMDLAEKALQTAQELPVGTVLDDATLLSRAGFRADDAKAIKGIIADANKKFGIDLAIGARTSEPLSAGIDGVAKREFIKPKAVSVLDKLLGAEESLGGRASVFDPKMPSADVLKGLEAKVPGITEKLEARFADQRKLFVDYADPNSGLRQLIKGGRQYKDGVRAIVERPGFTLPGDLAGSQGKPAFAYLEQLDEPNFLRSRGISADRAAELKSELSKFPDSGQTKLQAKFVNGTTTFTEGLEGGKPIISDLDLQFVEPEGGWPPGKRAQIETYINARMKEIDRFPQHGWSDTAPDISASAFDLAAKFKLVTTNPALAKVAAEQMEARYKSVAKVLRKQASRIRLAGTPEQFAADIKRRDKLLAKAVEFENTTADALLKKYPPGEKIIVFKAGDARIGYSTGGK